MALSQSILVLVVKWRHHVNISLFASFIWLLTRIKSDGLLLEYRTFNKLFCDLSLVLVCRSLSAIPARCSTNWSLTDNSKSISVQFMPIIWERVRCTHDIDYIYALRTKIGTIYIVTYFLTIFRCLEGLAPEQLCEQLVAAHADYHFVTSMN